MIATAEAVTSDPVDVLERNHLARRLRSGHFELLVTAAGALLADTTAPFLPRRGRLTISTAIIVATFVPTAGGCAALLVTGQGSYRTVLILGWMYAIGLLSLFTTRHLIGKFFGVLAGDVVPALPGRADVGSLARSLKGVFSPGQQTVFIGLTSSSLAVVSTILLHKVDVDLARPACMLVVGVASTLVAQGLYVLIPALEMPQILRRTGLVLFSLDPAQSAAVQSLSDLVTRGTVLAAANASLLAGGLFGWGFVGSRESLALVALLLWAPFVALFTYHHMTLGHLIERRRRETLLELQQRIDGGTADIATVGLEKLLDLHSRVRDNKTVAIDGQKIVTLVNSLLIPLLAPILKVWLNGR